MDQPAKPTKGTGEGIGTRVALARLALFLETMWPVAWPVPALLALFVALALFDVLPVLPGWLHALVLLGFASALAALIWRARGLRWPRVEAARRRVEADSGLRHGPLQALADELAVGAGDAVAQGLWEAHRRRLRASVGHLAWSRPMAVLPAHDPYGLRFAALLLLAIAAAGGWRDTGGRLARALEPDTEWLLGPPPSLQVWITPPDYTHVAPIFLQSLPAGAAIKVPARSRLLAELQGGSGAAKLAIGDEAHPFQRLDADSQRLDMALDHGGKLSVSQGWRGVGGWPVEVTPNAAPTISFAEPPAPADERLRFEIAGDDQYGLARAWVTIRRADRPDGQSFQVPIPLAGHPAKLRQTSWHDLTSNPWAGLPVTLTPGALDAAGLTGEGAAASITLPERRFTHPAARAIIALRKALARDPEDREPAIQGLQMLGADPGAFGGDVVVELALGAAAGQLMWDRTAGAVPQVLDTLWQTALRIEEGDRPAAERSVDEAARALEKALDENAPQAEIDRLTAELQAAIDRLLKAMVEQAMRQGALAPLPPDTKTITQGQLDNMLDQMRNLSQTGSRDAARQMLDNLRRMLEGLRVGMPMMSSPQGLQAREAQRALDAIRRDEQSLLDSTFLRAHDNMPGGASPDEQGAGLQEAIRHRLGDAMQALGDMGLDIPDGLGEAEQRMREAAGALGRGDLDEAVRAETQALDKLGQGARAAAQAMADKMGGTGPADRAGKEGRDPLGRELPGTGADIGDTVKIPTEGDVQKAREVLDELRRRSGELARPRDERDYLNRLLEQLY